MTTFQANSPDFVQSYLMGYAVMGGALGGVGYTYMSGGGMGEYVRHVLVGGASGYALKYINMNVLGSPGKSQGPIPHRYIPMTLSGAVAGYAVSWMLGARV
jgi:hypothetical protein